MLDDFRFLVDESGFEHLDDDVGSSFEVLVSRIAACRSHGVAKFSAIWDTPIKGHPLHQWLFGRDFEVDRDVARALMVSLDRSPNWDEEPALQETPIEVQLEGVSMDAYSLGAACLCLCQGRAIGAISPLRTRLGPYPCSILVQAQLHVSLLHFVGEEQSTVTFFRSLLEVENVDEDRYFEFAPYAFPSLRFHRERTQFSAFDESYRTLRAKVTQHLAVLNDYAVDIFSRAKDARLIEREFSARGVTASGESGNTKGNAAAMRQRQIAWNGAPLDLEWHTKLRRHIDRIYFSVVETVIVVGIFHGHLD